MDVKNYEGKYKISNLGRVKSLERQVSHDGITGHNPNASCVIGAGRLRSMTASGSTKTVSGRSSPYTA
ncbi:NUMOD4 domain-containing protein [Bacteroides fragilis]|nr:NUMOD4 domain-containing protein [Bacteroides fragilis]